MRRTRPLLAPLGLFGLSLYGCYETPSVKPGAPTLLAFELFDPTGLPIELGGEAGVPLVPPRARAVARFDRLLDPAPLEEFVDGGAVGRAGVVRVEAPGAPTAAVSYVPNGDSRFTLFFSSGPRLEIVPLPALPAGSTVTLRLERDRLLAKDGKTRAVVAAETSDVLTFSTAPFAAALALVDEAAPTPDPADGGAEARDAAAAADASVTGPDGGAEDDAAAASDALPAAAPPDADGPLEATPGAVVAITFNSLPAADAAASVRATAVDATGAALPPLAPVVSADERDPAHLVVGPPPGGWPVGARVTVTVGAEAADLFGMKLGAAAGLEFVVRAR